MISYLKGTVIDVINRTSNRLLLIIEVNGIGYEVQVTPSLSKRLKLEQTDNIQIFTHYQVREEQPLLYGFASAAERDLFRQLISVAGIGTQLAIALIDTLGLEELVQAIITGNTRVLTKTPGVGDKTAQRIALELKNKLKQWRKLANIQLANLATIPKTEILEDLEITLLALGYTSSEIEQAISLVSQDSQLSKNPQVEEWLKKAIVVLSQS